MEIRTFRRIFAILHQLRVTVHGLIVLFLILCGRLNKELLIVFIIVGLNRRLSSTVEHAYRMVMCVIRRRLTFGGVRRRRYADRKAELPLIAAYDVALRARRLDGQDDTGDESDCTGTGDLQFLYDCKRPLQCYQVC